MPYRTGEVCRRLNVSPRMLQWWDEKGVVSPRIVGHHREYDDLDLERLQLVMKLRAKSVSLQEVRIRIRKSFASGHPYYVLMKNKLRACATPEDALRLCVEARGPVVVVEMDCNDPRFAGQRR